MRKACPQLILVLFVLQIAVLRADEPLDIAATYQRIARDYRLVDQGLTSTRRDALGRITRDAYQRLIHESAGREDLTADDMFSLASCYEALGNAQPAIAYYQQSLRKEPRAKTHLSLVRMYAGHNMPAAEQHYASAVKLQPDFPGLGSYHETIGDGYVQLANWQAASVRYRKYADYLKVLADRSPADAGLAVTLGSAQVFSRQAGKLAAMIGSPPPTCVFQQWIQGKPTTLKQLKGQVVVLDFFGVWAEPSLRRMEWLKQLHEKHQKQGVMVIGITRPFGYRWHQDENLRRFEPTLSSEQESEGVAEFAKQHSLGFALAMISEDGFKLFQAESLPHTLVLDKSGRIQTILRRTGDEGLQRVENEIVALTTR